MHLRSFLLAPLPDSFFISFCSVFFSFVDSWFYGSVFVCPHATRPTAVIIVIPKFGSFFHYTASVLIILSQYDYLKCNFNSTITSNSEEIMQTHHNLHHFFMILHYTLSNDYKYGGLSMIDILLVDDEPRMLDY